MVFVIIAARRMCFNLSALNPSRYLSVKSSLNLPLKFRRCFFACDLLSEAIFEAMSSANFPDAMTFTL